MIGKTALQILFFALPWGLRRRLLGLLFDFELEPSSRIGFSLVLVRKLKMGTGSKIGHLNFCRSLSLLDLSSDATIDHLNWISAMPENTAGPYFGLDLDRRAELVMGPHAALTSRHRLDCTDSVRIGAFSTVAGWGSQIRTHGIDIRANRQRAGAIIIGDYCYVGTGVILLKNSELPSHSVLAAGSVLNKRHAEPYGLYSGVPAERVKELDKSSAYFSRTSGVVY